MVEKIRGRARKKKSIPKKVISKKKMDLGRRREEPQIGTIKMKWAFIFILGIFVLALFLRTYFIWSPATEDGYKLTGGSDPYYHKRVVDYVQDEKKHLMQDDLLNYPLGSKNPRPPAFDWSMAVLGMAASPFFDGDTEESTWWVLEIMPALWGALIVFPLYFLGKEQFGAKAGLIIAFLIATMAGAVGHSVFSLADHDSFVLFFVAVTFFFYVKAIKSFGTEKWVKNWMDLKDIRNGFYEFLVNNKIAIGYSALAGMSLGTISLSWKGYAYVMTVIAVYATVQIFIDHFRGTDALGVTICSLVVMAVPLIISFPYYAFSLAQAGGWWTPGFYIFFGLVIVSLILVPTRDLPWVIVIPSIIGFIIVGSILVEYIFGGSTSTIFGGMGYFYRTKLYETIAEAQPPEFSRAVFSYGIITIYLALIGLVLMIIRFPKQWKRDHLFIIIWGIVSIYMALSAVRFMFNATPIFALLAGAFLWEIIVWIDYKGMMRTIHGLRGDRLHAIKKGVGLKHIIGALFVAFLIVFPNTYFAVDAAIPFEDKKKWDTNFYEFMPSFFRPEEYNYTSRSNTTLYPDGVTNMYNKTSGGNYYLGAFGPSFTSEFWLDGFDWLMEEDKNLRPEDRPAFVSWWDYGFWCVNLADHPTVADNFQQGYQIAGTLLTAQSEKETIALFAFRILQGDIRKGMNDGVENALDKYLTNKQKEEIIDIIKQPQDYDEKGDDVSYQNTQLRLVRDILMELTEDELVWFLHDIQEATGDSIRYFAGDHRLFPFSAQNTGIFYAPVRLSDQDINDFLQTMYVTDTGERLTREQVEERAQENPDFQIQDFELKYTDKFFDTMFFKTFIGWSGRDIDQEDGGIPGVSGNVGQYRPMPAWMMKHFKLVYINDGVRFIKFYEGAFINGTVRTEKGTPVENAHVTLLGKDYTEYGDYWTPHDKTITDSNGNYSVLAPFGEVQVVASYGNISSFSRLSNIGTMQLNESYFNITDDQAMRKRDFEIYRDLIVKPAHVSGTIYWDNDDNDNFDANSDEAIEGLNVELKTKEGKITNSTTDQWGGYNFEDVAPGEYNISFVINDKKIEIKGFGEADAINPDAELTEDLGISPAKVHGIINHKNGTAFKNANISMTDENGNKFWNISDDEGRYEISKLLYGEYTIQSEIDGYMLNLSKEEAELDIIEYDDITLDLTFERSAKINGLVTAENMVERVKIEFRSKDSKRIYTVVSDKKGNYEIELPKENFEVVIANHTRDDNHYVYLETISIREPFYYDIELIKGVKVNGSAYIDKNKNENLDNNENKIRAMITFRSDEGAFIFNSNNIGNYEFYLPPDTYSINSEYSNETANKTYAGIKTLKVRENSPRICHIGLIDTMTIEGILYNENDIIENISDKKISGTIIFNKIDESGIEEGNVAITTDGYYKVHLPKSEYKIVAQGLGYEEFTDNVDLKENMDLDIELATKKIIVKGKTTSNKVIGNVEIEFNGLTKGTETTKVNSDENGNYEVELMPGDYDIWATKTLDTGVQFYKNLGIGVNLGDETKLVNINMIKSVRIYGKTYFDNNTNGRIDKGENIEILEFTITGQQIEHIFSENGEYERYLLPGEYTIYSNYTSDNITYVYLKKIYITKEMELDITPEKNTSVEGFVYYYNNNNEINEVVTLLFKGDNRELNASTDEIGRFEIDIPSGSYTVTIDQTGFESFTEEIEINPNEENHFDPVLTVKKIMVNGTVEFYEVTGEKRDMKVKLKFDGEIDATVDESIYTNKTGHYEIELNPSKNEIDYEIIIDHYENNKKELFTNRFSRDPDELPRPMSGEPHSRDTVRIDIAGEAFSKNMSLVKKYRISGKTYFDRNNNKKIDEGEILEYTIIEFRDEASFVYDESATSDSDGYTMYLEEGNYTIMAHNIESSTYAYIGNIYIKNPMNMDIPLIRGVRINGTIYSNELNNTLEPEDIMFELNNTLIPVKPNGSEYEITLPIGTYGIHTFAQKPVSEGPDLSYTYDNNLTISSSDDPLIFNINMEETQTFGLEMTIGKNVSFSFINGFETYSVTVRNTGNQTENVILSSEPSLDNWTAGFTPERFELEPKETKKVEIKISADENATKGQSAEFKIIATVSEETDIIKSINITTIAKERPLPDYIIKSIEFLEKPKEGKNVTIKVIVENPVIDSNESLVDVTLIVDGEPVTDQVQRVTVIAGEETAVEFIWMAKEGKHNFEVIVDSDNMVNESNENNNFEDIDKKVSGEPIKWNKIFGILIFIFILLIILMIFRRRK